MNNLHIGADVSISPDKSAYTVTTSIRVGRNQPDLFTTECSDINDGVVAACRHYLPYYGYDACLEVGSKILYQHELLDTVVKKQCSEENILYNPFVQLTHQNGFIHRMNQLAYS